MYYSRGVVALDRIIDTVKKNKNKNTLNLSPPPHSSISCQYLPLAKPNEKLGGKSPGNAAQSGQPPRSMSSTDSGSGGIN